MLRCGGYEGRGMRGVGEGKGRCGGCEKMKECVGECRG